MSKIRIYELAKQLGVANKDLVAKINSIGIEAKSHMAMLTEEEAAKVTALYQPKKEMCIRDSSNNTRKGGGIAGDSSLLQRILRPVSYTHLDVYKRQGKRYLRRGRTAFEGGGDL